MGHKGNIRIKIFGLVTVLVCGLIVYRLFVLSVVRHSVYLRTAQAQNENISNILARGNVYMTDKNGEEFLVATNKKFPLVYAVPSKISSDKKGELVLELERTLGLEKSFIESRINSDSGSQKVIKRKVSNEEVDKIKSLNIDGLGILYETDRFYPAEDLGSDIIGFLGYNEEGLRSGQYGIESYYDDELFGREKSLNNVISSIDLDPKKLFKKLTKSGESEDSSEENKFDYPADIVLTIDKNIQSFIESELNKVLSRWSSIKGTIIVQEPSTGKILAIADQPTFNVNNYSESDSSSFLNGSVQEIYEPGSSFKPVTMAAGLDLGEITPTTTYNDNGFVEVSGYTIKNFDSAAHGINTMTQVLEKSLNTGTMFVEDKVGNDKFLDYVINMGFGQTTGIDLPGEVAGDITNLYSGRKVNFLTASFGQGIAVTPLQMVNAYSTIANGGKLMRPYIVEKVIKDGGEEVTVQPEVLTIPITEKTSLKLKTMLVSVVDNGFDKARIKGYDIAGKTGTAQMPDGNGGYSQTEFIHNFIGFAPAYDPKFVILIKMDKPQGISFAADSLSPTFKEIAEFLISYYGIPPTR